jgi:hypothetical protein
MIRDITDELADPIETTVFDAFHYSAIANIRNAGIERTRLPFAKELAHYFDAAGDLATWRKIRESIPIAKSVGKREDYGYRRMFAPEFADLWAMDDGDFIRRHLVVQGTPDDDLVLNLADERMFEDDSDWLLDKPLSAPEISIIISLVPQMFDWLHITLRELVFLLRRRRALWTIGSDQLGDTEIVFFRNHMPADTALAWSVLPFSKPNGLFTHEIPKALAGYDYDTVAAYVYAGVTDPYSIARLIRSGIDPSLAASFAA